jgi:hypothetical protein
MLGTSSDDTFMVNVTIAATKRFFSFAEALWFTVMAVSGQSISTNPLTVLWLKKAKAGNRSEYEKLQSHEYEQLSTSLEAFPISFSDWVKFEKNLQGSSFEGTFRPVPAFYTLDQEKIYQLHRDRLIKMLMANELTAINSENFDDVTITLAIVFYIANPLFNDVGLPLDQFKKFANAMRIGVVIEEKGVEAPPTPQFKVKPIERITTGYKRALYDWLTNLALEGKNRPNGSSFITYLSSIGDLPAGITRLGNNSLFSKLPNYDEKETGAPAITQMIRDATS